MPLRTGGQVDGRALLMAGTARLATGGLPSCPLVSIPVAFPLLGVSGGPAVPSGPRGSGCPSSGRISHPCSCAWLREPEDPAGGGLIQGGGGSVQCPCLPGTLTWRPWREESAICLKSSCPTGTGPRYVWLPPQQGPRPLMACGQGFTCRVSPAGFGRHKHHQGWKQVCDSGRS